MTVTKVIELSELEKLKAEKRLTAKKCGVEGCDKIGAWDIKANCFYLQKGMCQMHFQRFIRHGDLAKVERIYKGYKSHELYHTWSNIKGRILNPKDKNYNSYGGRGLLIEPRWIVPAYGFQNFLEDIAYLGEKPKGYTLDRIKNGIGYFANNLRWANSHQQCANRRSNNKNVGVYYYKIVKKWEAQLCVNSKILRELFDSESEAIMQRKEWELEYKIYE